MGNISGLTAGGPQGGDDEQVGPSSFVIGGADSNPDNHETAGNEDAILNLEKNNFGLMPDDDVFVDNDSDSDHDVLDDEDAIVTMAAPSFGSPQEEGYLKGGSFMKGKFGKGNLKLKNGENSHGYNGTLY